MMFTPDLWDRCDACQRDRATHVDRLTGDRVCADCEADLFWSKFVGGAQR